MLLGAMRLQGTIRSSGRAPPTCVAVNGSSLYLRAVPRRRQQCAVSLPCECSSSADHCGHACVHHYVLTLHAGGPGARVANAAAAGEDTTDLSAMDVRKLADVISSNIVIDEDRESLSPPTLCSCCLNTCHYFPVPAPPLPLRPCAPAPSVPPVRSLPAHHSPCPAGCGGVPSRDPGNANAVCGLDRYRRGALQWKDFHHCGT